MAANQQGGGASQVHNHNDEAADEEISRTMGYYMSPRPVDIESPILHPTVAASNFEIKPALVTMIQNNALFHGLPSESPREHVQRFLELTGSLKINGMSAEALQLRLFPYSLAGKAIQWLNSRPPRPITSCDDLPVLPAFEDGRVEKEDHPFRARGRQDLEGCLGEFLRLLPSMPSAWILGAIPD
ncbi:unnamed protein product [Linum trigynum]|uniref:Uncharacterized protein n=1 Tax=Linum trigynum TaxID=586398 RepID=A0AAV2E8P5_9ROSI